MISANDRVASVLAGREQLVEVFVGASPAFKMLRDATARKTMARLVTVEQAARIAGIDASVLVGKLNAALGEATPSTPKPAAPRVPTNAAPPGLLQTPAEKLVVVDVREDLRAGREPFRRIFDAARSLGPDQVLQLRAIFEPVPLYAVLGKQNLAHFTERLADDDWRIWFHRSQVVSTPVDAAPVEPPADANVVVLDVRGLEPPEPMERTLEALATLERGKTLVQLNVRVPQFLLPRLEERGFQYEVREQSAELVRIFIRHKP